VIVSKVLNHPAREVPKRRSHPLGRLVTAIAVGLGIRMLAQAIFYGWVWWHIVSDLVGVFR
jgi:hypothetical protein